MKWVWEFKWGKMKSDESGYVMVMAIFVLVVTSLIAVGLAVVGANEFQLSARTRLMDTAYQIAESGISRACVYIKDNPSVVLSTGSGAHDYPSDTPQWRSGTPESEYKEDFGVTGWPGTYRVSIWQSELAPDNPYYKVIKSTGTVDRNGKTAERTIETRIIAGPSTTDYDASFDYCIYNGFYGAPDYGEAATDTGVWPNTNYWLGTMEIDGVTPYQDHSPKGAIYTRGTITIPTAFLSGCTFHGNLVATNDINLSCSYALSGAGLGVKVDNLDEDDNPVPGQGNVIAGLDGTGSVTLKLKNTINTYTAGITVTPGVPPDYIPGYVVAADDVIIDEGYNWAIGGKDRASILTGGVICGGDLTMTSTGSSGAAQAVNLGNVFCSGTANLTSSFGGIKFNQLSAGGTPTGVYIENKTGEVATGAIYSEGLVEMKASSLNKDFSTGDVYVARPLLKSVDINAASDGITVGDITAQGGVVIAGTTNSPSIGSITAGIDNTSTPVGNGVTATVTSNMCTVDSITAKGYVKLDVTSTGSIDYIWSGGDVTLKMSSIWALVSIGDISARGNVSLTGGIVIAGGIPVGRVSAEGNVKISFSCFAFAGMTVEGIKAGGDVNASVTGVFFGGLFTNPLNPWNRGPGTPDAPWPLTPPAQQDPANNSIDAGGNIDLSATGWLVGLGVTRNVRACKTVFTTGWVTIANLPPPPQADLVALQDFKPGVDDPGTPASPWTHGPTTGYPSGSPADSAAWLESKAPIVDPSLLLLLADRLEGPVQFLEPNWSYFAESAANDEGKVCPNPECLKTNPKGSTVCEFCGANLTGVPDKKTHILKDTGLAADGDYGGVAGDNKIVFKWDASSIQNYSSNETIYQDDVNVDVIVDIKWAGRGADFTGSLVTKGGIRISNALGLAWTFDTGQELNMVSGKSIRKDSSGITLLKVDNVAYHWWARNNIDFTDMVFALVTVSNFRGSFTAGNRVIYNISDPTAFWKISYWKWTRWSLDTRAWLPPFTVLSYKEM